MHVTSLDTVNRGYPLDQYTLEQHASEWIFRQIMCLFLWNMKDKIMLILKEAN